MYSDDWAFARIDPVTHQVDWFRWPFERNYFWRPALQAFLYYGFQLFREHLWVLHLINVSCHAGAAWGVYWLSRRLRHTPHASAVGAMVFLLFPFQYEVIFWSTAMTSGIPAGLVLIVCALVVAYATRSGLQWRLLAAMSGLMFVAVCFYEQPCAIAAGFPMLYLAVRQPQERWGESLKRIAAMLIACGVPLVVYILLLRFTAPASARGGAGSFTTAAELPARLAELRGAFEWYFGPRIRNAFLGGLVTAIHELASVRGSICAALVGITGGSLLVAWHDRPVPAISAIAAERSASRRRYMWALGFALVATLAVWLPIIPIKNQILEARLSYCMCIGLGVLVASLLDVLGRLTRRWWIFPVLHGAVGLAAIVFVFVASLSMLGWQTVIKRRTQADTAQTATLASAFASVPPGTVFVLLKDEYRPAQTGRLAFDWPALGWTSAAWSSTAALKWTMKRDDIAATAVNIWVPPPFSGADDAAIVYTGGLAAGGDTREQPGGGLRIEWDKAVPYFIDARGAAVPVREVHVLSKSGKPPVVGRSKLTSQAAHERFVLEVP